VDTSSESTEQLAIVVGERVASQEPHDAALQRGVSALQQQQCMHQIDL